MYLETIFEILVAFFAVVGVWAFFKLTLGRMFGEKNYIYTIEILTQRDAESAEVLIRRALCQYFLLGSGRIALLVSEEFASDEILLGLCKKYGVELILVG